MSPQKRIDAVVDLETLGTRPTAPILEIGAVVVTKDGLQAQFQNYVRLDSALKHGTPDADTLLWWMSEDQDAARRMLVQGFKGVRRQALALEYALGNFDLWLRREGVTHLWANGASFDLGLLSHAHGSTGVNRQFDFRQERDLRTIFDLRWKPERKLVSGIVPHCALHDAMVDGARLWEVLHGQEA